MAVSARDVSAELPGRHAGLICLAGQRETRQRHSNKAASKSFQSLPPRYRLRHIFGQLVEFLVHYFFLLLSFRPERMMHKR
jgi:hypothetical protein